MKVVVTAQGRKADSEIDERFGRCGYLLFYDTDTGDFAAHENSKNLNAAQGAGIQTAAAVSRLGAEYVITGHCGPKAFAVLQSANIKVIVGVTGKADKAIAELTAGKLREVAQSDVDGHWK
ncbi:MAG: hypothetical protein A2583_12690 [Bdellovibrionales bacterium RIFOXYD1_FULL_53_11]|nr:MAG: hypothetical protein A2583_12690 [Bdellovibrionales bacterium RIFOXYD1_FULL_53_11]